MWFQFRDVLDVDGVAIAGRDKRMMELFVNPPANLVQRLRDVAEEGTR